MKNYSLLPFAFASNIAFSFFQILLLCTDKYFNMLGEGSVSAQHSTTITRIVSDNFNGRKKPTVLKIGIYFLRYTWDNKNQVQGRTDNMSSLFEGSLRH